MNDYNIRRMNANQRAVARRIRTAIDLAHDTAIALILDEARRILRGRNPAHSFCMGMGTAAFYDREGNPMDDDHKAFGSFYAFIHEFNSELYMTGTPCRIQGPDAPVETDW